MYSEGLLWFTDLTAPDPFYALPIFIWLLSVTNIKMSSWVADKRFGLILKPSQTIIQNIGCVFVSFFGIFSSFFPSGLQLLIFSNLVTNFVLTALYRLKLFRTVFRLPPNIGVVFSLEHSDPNKVKAAFGPKFGKTAPPPVDYVEKKTLVRRILNSLTGKKVPK